MRQTGCATYPLSDVSVTAESALIRELEVVAQRSRRCASRLNNGPKTTNRKRDPRWTRLWKRAPFSSLRKICMECITPRSLYSQEMKRDPGPGLLFNTLGLTDEVSDEQFDARFRALDPQALATEFHGDVAWLNGPRRALMDRMTLVVLDDAKITMIGDTPSANSGDNASSRPGSFPRQQEAALHRDDRRADHGMVLRPLTAGARTRVPHRRRVHHAECLTARGPKPDP